MTNKNLALVLLAALLFRPDVAVSTPILSADGSTLSGVFIQGGMYTVTFQDGSLDGAYDPNIVATLAWAAFVPDLVSAVNAAFATLGLEGSGKLIRGCSELSFCAAYIPDAVDASSFTSNYVVFYRPHFSPVDPVPALSLPLDFNTEADTTLSLITFEKVGAATVPLPGTVWILIGAILLLITRRYAAVKAPQSPYHHAHATAN